MLRPDSWIKKMALERGMIKPFEPRQIKDNNISYGLSSYGYDIRISDQFKIFKGAGRKDIIPDFTIEKSARMTYRLNPIGFNLARRGNPKQIFNAKFGIIDPKNAKPDLFEDFKGPVCIIPPNSFVLAMSLEYFKMPSNVLALCTGKSTYARIGVIVNVTPLEPSWEGYLTIEISNTSPSGVKIYANEGIGQVVFFESDEQCLITYADRKGKYQSQKSITLPK